MDYKSLEEFSYVIIRLDDERHQSDELGHNAEYFIPCYDDSALEDDFESLGQIRFNSPFQRGFLFDQDAIEKIRELFIEQEVPYFELSL